jgi:hypothetical protein
MTEDVASKSGGMNVITLLHAGSVRRTRRQMDDSSLHVQVVDIAKCWYTYTPTRWLPRAHYVKLHACMHAKDIHKLWIPAVLSGGSIDRSIDAAWIKYV